MKNPARINVSNLLGDSDLTFERALSPSVCRHASDVRDKMALEIRGEEQEQVLALNECIVVEYHLT